ncbi:MAG: hypothetical protein JSU68_09290 [Phycisphaerales bacterium]|nr:MAG: hypothetical protein JSU68_09290 [Phycisphaerales bacterium]
MEKRIGAALGFLAFTVAAISGAVVGNPSISVLKRAIVALFAFYLLGRALGWLAEQVLAEREQTLHQELDQEVQAVGRLEDERVTVPTVNPIAAVGPEQETPPETVGAGAKP